MVDSVTSGSDAVELTILMPCLNEAETIAACIVKATEFLHRAGVKGEVLIADNGSTDGSQEMAQKLGARIVTVDQRGYGAALLGGIAAARGQFIIMGDADDSYDFSALDPFVERLRQGDDLVMGNRFIGGIAPGAMPWLHRYVGNPILSLLGRVFFGIAVGDFHCGLRGFRADSIRRLGLRSTGMEFASEMVVRSALAGLRITEVPTTLRPDGRSRPPHLRTWRDGWRHLKFLLMFSPRWLYLIPGCCLIAAGILLGCLLALGPVGVGNVVLDLNTLLVVSFFAVAGVQIITFGVLSRYYANVAGFLPRSPRSDFLVRWVTTERLLPLSGVLFLFGTIGLAYASWRWAELDFGNLTEPFIPRLVIVSLTAMLIGVQTAFCAFMFGIFEIPIDRDQRRDPKRESDNE